MRMAVMLIHCLVNLHPCYVPKCLLDSTFKSAHAQGCCFFFAESPLQPPAEDGPAAAASSTADNKGGLAGASVPVEDAFPSFNQMAAAGIAAALQKPPQGTPGLDNFSFSNQPAEEVW